MPVSNYSLVENALNVKIGMYCTMWYPICRTYSTVYKCMSEFSTYTATFLSKTPFSPFLASSMSWIPQTWFPIFLRTEHEQKGEYHLKGCKLWLWALHFIQIWWSEIIRVKDICCIMISELIELCEFWAWPNKILLLITSAHTKLVTSLEASYFTWDVITFHTIHHFVLIYTYIPTCSFTSVFICMFSVTWW